MAYYRVDLYYEDSDSIWVEADSEKEAIEEAEVFSYGGCGTLVSKEIREVSKKEYEGNK